ncbi:MAG: cobalamin-dependent protein [Clostridiales Family XIII bacterium]|jgi:methanogenic corrinoid protein MtbC1|nr:cobalamin-dependent protein [Clostridiales Family XIII bacterium]
MADLVSIKSAVGELDEDLVKGMLDEFVATGPSPDDAQSVVAACQQGMDIVGEKYESGEYFVGDLIFAGELLSDCIDTLKPLIGSGGGASKGTIVLGTVEGDIHDIGKNIFKSMSEAAGFEVVDIGIDQKPEAFVDAVKTNSPEIVGLSGVLTLSIDSMKRTIEALAAADLRAGLKVTIGGNAASEDACKYVGADDWSRNAAEAVKTCGSWVS